MLIPQELQLSQNLGQSEKLFRLQKKVDKSCFHALHVLAQFENLGELVKNTIFVA